MNIKSYWQQAKAQGKGYEVAAKISEMIFMLMTNKQYQIDNTSTHDSYAPIDFFVTGKTGNITAIEAKCRFSEYNEYMLEVDKYKALMDAYKLSGYTPYYFNVVIDDDDTVKHLYLWNLLKTPIIPNFPLECPRVSSEDKGKRYKANYLLSPGDAYDVCNNVVWSNIKVYELYNQYYGQKQNN